MNSTLRSAIAFNKQAATYMSRWMVHNVDLSKCQYFSYKSLRHLLNFWLECLEEPVDNRRSLVTIVEAIKTARGVDMFPGIEALAKKMNNWNKEASAREATGNIKTITDSLKMYSDVRHYLSRKYSEHFWGE